MPTAHLPHSLARSATLKLPALRLGSSGSSVRVLQQLLNFQGFQLRVDGKFGTSTLEAVKHVQHLNNLPRDGIVDTQTWQCLSGELLPFIDQSTL